MLHDIFFDFLNHYFQRVKRLACCVVMEVKLLIFYLGFPVTFINLFYISIW